MTVSTRLPGQKYRRIFDRGRSVRGRLLVAWYLSDKDADRQAGVVVSKKTFHDAVDRNRAKRLMREAFRLAVKDGAMPEATDWIFVAKRGIAGKKVRETMEEILWCAKRSSRS